MAAFDLIDGRNNDMFELKKLFATKKKLNLGSNSDIRPDYINVDILNIEGLDIRCDLKDLHKYIPAASMEEVLAYDLLEHFPFAETKQILADWICWLAPGGKIIVRTPDMERLAHALIDSKLTVWDTQKLLYGGQEYDYNYHKSGYTSAFLEGLLLGAGCKEIVQVVKESDSWNCTLVGIK